MLALLLAPMAACVSDEPPPSIWPPEGFAFAAEEVVQEGARVETRRKFRLTEDGTVVYGLSSRPVVATTNDSVVALPVYERLSVYKLVPSAVRGFARRLHKLGFLTLDDTIGDPRSASGAKPLPIVVLKWSSVHGEKRVTLRGASRGTPAELLRAVASLLPDGEQFPGIEAGDRAPVSVLRGVPAPRTDVLGALAAHELLLGELGEDPDLLLDTFALACRTASRQVAEDLLGRWLQASPARVRSGFEDAAGRSIEPCLRQMLPAK